MLLIFIQREKGYLNNWICFIKIKSAEFSALSPPTKINLNFENYSRFNFTFLSELPLLK